MTARKVEEKFRLREHLCYFRNREYADDVRKYFYALEKVSPETLEGLWCKDIDDFVEECAVQFLNRLIKSLPPDIGRLVDDVALGRESK